MMRVFKIKPAGWLAGWSAGSRLAPGWLAVLDITVGTGRSGFSLISLTRLFAMGAVVIAIRI